MLLTTPATIASARLDRTRWPAAVTIRSFLLLRWKNICVKPPIPHPDVRTTSAPPVRAVAPPPPPGRGRSRVATGAGRHLPGLDRQALTLAPGSRRSRERRL